MIYRKDKIPDDLQQFFVRAEIGLEESPTEFIDQLVDVFREVRRVLRPDGTLWVNLGDSYCSTAPGTQGDPIHQRGIFSSVKNDTAKARQRFRPETPEGLKPKDLVGIPWRFAFALQADGWYLRSDIIWAKGNCMPESVTDRPTKAHEYVFLFAHPDSKGRYFYDIDAVRETSAGQTALQHRTDGVENSESVTTTRNKRSVWNVNPQPYSGSHFAVWPPALVEPMIRAGTSAHGVCASCGAPWKRVVERDEQPKPHVLIGEDPTRKDGGAKVKNHSGKGGNALLTKHQQTGGWDPTCDCVDAGPPVPATVLDPFSGSATTGMVALTEGRNYIGCDINPEFLDLAVARVEGRAAPTKDEVPVADVLDFFNLD